MNIRKISTLLAVGVLFITPVVSAKSHYSRGGRNNYKPPTHTPVPPVVTPPVTPPTTGGITLTNVYTTGYSSYDNTPRGSLQIDLDGHSGKAGGDGTYTNPTTLAIGHSIINGKDIPDFPYGTMFYVPNLKKYFSAQDTCGDGNTPQNGPCHSLKTADKGATLWLDLYVGPSTSSSVISCEEAITALHTVIQNPANNLPVISGNVFPGCVQYGDL
jgi:hypothetical protein